MSTPSFVIFSVEACEDHGGMVSSHASAWPSALGEACRLGPGTHLGGEDITPRPA